VGLEIDLIPLQPEKYFLTCSGFVGEESYRLLVFRKLLVQLPKLILIYKFGADVVLS